jgi:hypothetical protein
MSEKYVFISYSRRDQAFVERLSTDLRAAHVQVWRDVESIAPGTNWQEEIEKALLGAPLLLHIASSNTTESRWMDQELEMYLEHGGKVIPLVLDDAGENYLLNSMLGTVQWVDFRDDYRSALRSLLEGIGYLQQEQPAKAPVQKSKGYVFISYAEEDLDFVSQLTGFLGKRGYAYWDYQESERDYDADFFLEIEGRIRDAAGTLSLVSPAWKHSSMAIQEYLFSRDVKTPTFLVKVREFEPTLVITGRSYIDLTHDPEIGLRKLDKELKRKGL